MSFIRKSYQAQLSYDITASEKEQAEKALIAFNYALKLLHIASKYLNIMKVPFKDHQDIPNEELIKFRADLREYRDKVIEQFNNFKAAAFRCIVALNPFSLDTQTAKLKKSFIASVENIETRVNEFAEQFETLEDKAFVPTVVKDLTDIEKEVEQLEELIDDRIKTHIQTNILGKTWVDGVSNALQEKIETETPKLLELEQERQKQLSYLG